MDNPKKLKILHTPVRFYPAVGGVENHVYYLSKELVKNGLNVEVVCADVPKSDLKEYKKIKITRLSSTFNVTNTNITLGLPLYLLNSDFDIIHTHMPTPWTSDWSILIGKLKRKKTILTIHNDIQKVGFLSKLITDVYLNTVFRFSLATVDKIIIVNPDWETSFTYTRHLISPYKEKIAFIPNGVDTNLFKNTKSNKKNSILFVSILDKYHWFKGLDIAIQAIIKLKDDIPDIHMIIIGDGELKDHYQKVVNKQHLGKYIEFIGYKNQDELPDYFSEASVFILPSTDTEGFGIVLLESLACETPVIATDITGVSNKIQEKNCGKVIKTNDVSALAENIKYILLNPENRKNMGINGRKLIEEEFSWEIISKKITHLYNNILK